VIVTWYFLVTPADTLQTTTVEEIHSVASHADPPVRSTRDATPITPLPENSSSTSPLAGALSAVEFRAPRSGKSTARSAE